MYSPFLDRKGNQLNLSQLRFSHLSQLKDIDEGYKIEYKSTFDDSVKKKIPAIITSFANSEGGWLIIGIDDDSHDIKCIPKKRSDYNQTISQLLKERTSPIPTFDSRFLANPQNKNEGVLTVFVYEGHFPPYISNGTVYIRNGSSKEPIKTERATLDYLYQKSRRYEKSLEAFCKRTIYFPGNSYQAGVEKIVYPICNIYFKNIGFHVQKPNDYQDFFNELKAQVCETSNSIFSSAQPTFESIIFRHRPLDPSLLSITPTIEMFRDLSAKIHIPLSFSNDEERDTAIQVLKNQGLACGENIKICSGVDSFNCVFGALRVVAAIYDHNKLPVSDIAVCFETESSNNNILFFDGALFLERAKTDGLSYCSRMSSRSKIIFLKDYPGIDFDSVSRQLAYDFFLAEFGFFAADSQQMILQALKSKYPDLFQETQQSNISI